MTGVTVDTARLDETLKRLESVAEYKRSTSTQPERDTMYYQLLIDVIRSNLQAKEEGKYLVAHTAQLTPDIFYAMDIVPMFLEQVATTVVPVLKNYDECFSAARTYGLAPEVCSIHRLVQGAACLGWYPRPDAVVWSHHTCDNCAKTGDGIMELYECPGFFVDRPYLLSETAVQFYTRELEELVSFLEDLTGRKMDRDRLVEVMERTRRLSEVRREIDGLRRSMPAPMRGRRAPEMGYVKAAFSGSQRAVDFFEMVRDEVKEKADSGEGYTPQERHRLLNLYWPPSYSWAIMDWMENEHGAVSVAEPVTGSWFKGDIDPTRPLESLARYAFNVECVSLYEGSFYDILRAAVDHKADGAIFWAHIGCRMSCATIKMIKDALMEEAGVPTLVLDYDVNDPTYAPVDQLKARLEEFFELLEDRK